MKNLFLTIIFLFSHSLYSQVGINTSSPKAALDIHSTKDGLIVPRVTTAERSAMLVSSAKEGMLVFDTTLDEFYLYKGVSLGWEPVDKYPFFNAEPMVVGYVQRYVNETNNDGLSIGASKIDFLNGPSASGYTTVNTYTPSFENSNIVISCNMDIEAVNGSGTRNKVGARIALGVNGTEITSFDYGYAYGGTVGINRGDFEDQDAVPIMKNYQNINNTMKSPLTINLFAQRTLGDNSIACNEPSCRVHIGKAQCTIFEIKN